MKTKKTLIKPDKKPIGRPRDKVSRGRQIGLYLSLQEYQGLLRQSHRDLLNISAYLRRLIRDDADDTKAATVQAEVRQREPKNGKK